MDSSEPCHNCMYVEGSGFNLTKSRRLLELELELLLICQANGEGISLCAAISEHGVLTHIPFIGPYNTQHLLTFLEILYRALIPEGSVLR